ncbi:DUF4194 domain-containing protein [Nocardioides cynanchi]|uniref:DUF4194 domain-containing protein n=1 Tax=Nocardioides cynanchi TaxID=2558918 RepID=UPI00192D3052|nr:DUF4194 domain-containing protein [Nocardioides cynanchi]
MTDQHTDLDLHAVGAVSPADPADSSADPDEVTGAAETTGESMGSGDDAYLDDLDQSTLALWEGDEGTLDVAARRALVVLLKNRFISAQTHAREWKALLEHRRLIRARLNDLFLDLHLDLDREVAYKRQVVPEGSGRYPTLLYDAPWGREDTILLVFLRTRLRSEQASGADRVFVDREEMLEAITEYRPEHATDAAGDAKRAAKAIETVYKAGLLIGPSTGDRFEVSIAIEVLLPLERLQDLLRWLMDQNGTDPESPDSEGNSRQGDDVAEQLESAVEVS